MLIFQDIVPEISYIYSFVNKSLILLLKPFSMQKAIRDADTTHIASRKKATAGLWFFFIYLVFYAGFVTIGVTNYELLTQQFFGGVNLAIFYGIGLIVFAVLLGILYNILCSYYESTESQNRDAL